ncbi:3'-5' exonuclease [Tulasnella sp. 332]|nr:3'-5' exonuclease [Tulasnella sp. 332]
MHGFCSASQPLSCEIATDSRDVPHLRKMVLGHLEYADEHLSHLGRYLALNCETEEVTGPGGKGKSLARVSIVNFYGVVLLDVVVSQTLLLADHCLCVLRAKEKVKYLIRDRVLVGHDLREGLQMLDLTHPETLLHEVVLNHESTRESPFPPSLAKVIWVELGLTIDVRDSDSKEDSVMCARAAMAIFRLHREMYKQRFEPVFVTGSVAMRSIQSDSFSQSKYPSIRPVDRYQQDRGRFASQLRQSAPAYQQVLLRSCGRLDTGIGGLLLRSYQRNMPERYRAPDEPSSHDDVPMDRQTRRGSIKKPGFLSGFKKRVRWGTNTYVS